MHQIHNIVLMLNKLRSL